ncbi:unnamed protein product [Somion occarium]|uniref:NAD(P)-binding protein n=1 Tax=Somion occarium TaxID=3059160 RepID=A0ABP1E0T9_9APHY
MANPRVWLITGASSGFGRLMSELVLSKGDIAVATARKPEALDDLKAKYPSTKLLVLKLDVTQAHEIKDVFIKIKETFGRLDVVFNNAGYAMMGEVEATPEDAARTMFDTNFWGATNVSLETVKFFREENRPAGGRLIVNSSEKCFNFIALEGVTSALVQELDPEWNIKITLVEPGTFRTPAIGKLGEGYSHPAYNKPTLPGNLFRVAFHDSGLKKADTSKGVLKIYDLSLLSEPPFRLPLGKDALEMIRGEAKSILEDAAKYEVWSEGLDFDT